MIGNFFYSNSGAAAYQIEQSLRFDAATNAYLRNASLGIYGNTNTTISFWLKHSTKQNGNIFACGANPSLWSLEIGPSNSGGGRWLNNGGTIYIFPDGAGKLRDPAAWYHIVLRQTGNQSTIFLNGVQTNNNNSNSAGTNTGWYIGNEDGAGNNQLDGYLAEFIHVDGTALDPSSFGEFDDNGVWRPIAYTGSYGTKGFYLKFDPSATNGIGHDHSGNGNNFSPSGFSTSGTGTDVMSDTPTTNWATLNPIFKENTGVGGGIFINGNLEHQEGSSNFRHTVSTQALPSSGKVYVEVESDVVASNFGSHFGLMLESTLNAPDSANNFVVICQSNGTLQIEGTNQGSQSAGDVFSLSVDMSASPIQIVVRKNNTVVGTNPYTLSTTETLFFYSRNIYGSRLIWNFGQRAFAYTPPTGYNALNTANLPEPTVKKGGDHFNTVLYTGNGASPRAITGVGFAPDFTWIKIRSQATNHVLQDRVRGATAYLNSNTTQPENTNTQINFFSSFDSDGFTIRYTAANGFSYYETNLNGNTYVAWNWKANGAGSSNTAGTITSTVSANPTAGFSIVTYSGNSTNNSTIGHGLGVAPAMIITKLRTGASNEGWPVWHKTLGNTQYLQLNQTSAVATDSNIYGGSSNTAPTSTVYSVGAGGVTNTSGRTYVAYCFAEVEGYSKFGSYIGNTSTDGVFINTGFRPAFVMIKLQNAGGHWCMYDSTRFPYNPITHRLYASAADAETNAGTPDIDFVSNGFKLRTSEAYSNNSSYTYIFAAFAEHPTGGANVSPATAR